jgi:putative ABC transport system permease protein
MIFNYIKLAVRNILRHKAYSIINIAGLAIGMASTILMLLWVQFEFSFDRFHENSDRIYRLEMKWDIGKKQGRFPVVQHSAGPALVREYPEAIQSVRFRHSWHRPLVQYKDKKFHETNIIFAENSVFDIISYFTFLAIFIACMGLSGLASFASEQRTKEIGIRKAMGASEKGIVLLLCKEFTKCVLVANIIAWPIAYFVFKDWLENYAYRTNISLWIFLLAALLALVIALLTVSYQAVKAAKANPINALRYE